jgi:hypothetical protein
VIFSPMAHTYAFAIGGAIVLAMTLTPVLVSKIMRTDLEETESRIMHVLHRLYNPLFDAALKRPKWSLLISLIPIVLCVVLFPFLGREFMPKLEEGISGFGRRCRCRSRSSNRRSTRLVYPYHRERRGAKQMSILLGRYLTNCPEGLVVSYLNLNLLSDNYISPSHCRV